MCVWTNLELPSWPPVVPPWKEKLSSGAKAKRSKLPPQIGEAFLGALESQQLALF